MPLWNYFDKFENISSQTLFKLKLKSMKYGLFFFLLIAISTSIFAQENKGNIFVETGVNMFGGSEYFAFAGKTGISFNKYKYNSESGSFDYKYDSFTYSIAPRIGYFLNNNLAGGFESQYYKQTLSYDETSYRIASFGLFLRLIFPGKRILPLAEIHAGIGGVKDITDHTSSGGGVFQKIEINNLYYYGCSAGITILMNQKVRLNLLAKIQNTNTKFSEKSNFGSSNFNENNLEIGPILSVSYIFTGKSKISE